MEALGVKVKSPEPLFHLGSTPAPAPLVKVRAHEYKDGYNNFRLQGNAAAAYESVLQKVEQAGALITSSGSLRGLGAKVGAARSATSFHYSGLALDLGLASGMNNPHRDPMVCTWDGDSSGRRFRVYARAEHGEQMTLDAVSYDKRQGGIRVTGKFIDLTALFEAKGFERIRCRKSFLHGGSYLGAEWWHF